MSDPQSLRDIVTAYKEGVVVSDWQETEPEDGAIVFFGNTHAGIIIDGRVLHARQQFGVCHEPLNRFVQRKRIVKWQPA